MLTGNWIIHFSSTSLEKVQSYNTGTLNMLNVTLSDQPTGLLVDNGSVTTLQNSVLNTESNLTIRGSAEIISQGGNISSDNTMTEILTGSGDYLDLNQTDPILGPDMCPIAGSPCIDMGNPDGVTQNAVDINGNPRIQGNGIDAVVLKRLWSRFKIR
jgi:hypothetical protein